MIRHKLVFGECCWVVVSVTSVIHGQGITSGDKRAHDLVAALGVGNVSTKHLNYILLKRLQPLPKSVIPKLANTAKSGDQDSKVFAAALLAQCAPKTPNLVDTLEQGLTSPRRMVGVAALEGLDPLIGAKPPVNSKIIALMTSYNNQVKQAAVPVIGRMGKGAIAPLKTIILGACRTKRRNLYAAMALGALGPDAAPEIVQSLQRDNTELNWHMLTALKAMPNKPRSIIPEVLRLSKIKDYRIRRVAFEVLLGMKPATIEVEDAIWRGMRDTDSIITRQCFAKLVWTTPASPKWRAALTSYIKRSASGYGSNHVTALHVLYKIDPRSGNSMLPTVARAVLNSSHAQFYPLVHFAVLGKRLRPIMPDVYKTLDDRSPRVRRNALTVLAYAPSVFSQPVVDKLYNALKDKDLTNSYLAAKALLQTNGADKAKIARALGIVAGARRLKFDVKTTDVLQVLSTLGPDAKAATPSLRVSMFSSTGYQKSYLLLAFPSIDTSMTATVIREANKWHRGTGRDKLLGACVLVRVSADAKALKTLAAALDDPKQVYAAETLVGRAGPNAKSLIPRLQARVNDPLNRSPIRTVVALAQVDGDIDAAVQRLLAIAKKGGSHTPNAVRAIGELGPGARAAIPAIVAYGRQCPDDAVYMEALIRIDPAALALR